MAAGRRSPNQSIQGADISSDGSTQVARVFQWIDKLVTVYGGADATKDVQVSLDIGPAVATFVSIAQFTGTGGGVVEIPRPVMYVRLLISSYVEGTVLWQVGGTLYDTRKSVGPQGVGV
jgi:hypothetical protein